MFYLYDTLFDTHTIARVTVIDVYPDGFKVEDKMGNTERFTYETVRFSKV